MTSWAVLQLRDGVDLATPVSELEREFLARWPASLFKFPAVKQGCLDRDNPLSAYVFVAPPVPPRPERSRLIASVLRDPATHKPYLITEADLAAMVPLPAFPPTGSTVVVTSGDFSGLEGVVVEVNCLSCKVLIELWSKQRVVTLAANELVGV